jgi:hypothetical protein
VTDPRVPPTAQEEVLVARADHLARALVTLQTTVASLDERAAHIEQTAAAAGSTAEDARRGARRAVIAIGVLIVIAVVLGWLVWRNHQTIQQLNQVQAQGISLRQNTLCPILQAALANSGPQARAVFPAGPVAYDAFIAKIKHGVDSIPCAPLTGGR